MHPILNIAIQAARRAGDYIRRASERLDQVEVSQKQEHDFVTNVDKRAEEIICEIIQENYPSHAITAEEGSNQEGEQYEWIVDPLDGTTNFLHGFPHYAVSIGIKYQGKLEYAVVYDPLRNDLFQAARGRGAQLNNRRIRVSTQPQLAGALLGTGFPFKQKEHIDTYLATFKELFNHASGVRRAGSAALDLAYVAAGRLDGFWEFGLHPWDIAGGILLVKEAGGLVSDLHGGEDYLATGNIIAGNAKVLKGICQSVRPLVNSL